MRSQKRRQIEGTENRFNKIIDENFTSEMNELGKEEEAFNTLSQKITS